MIYDFILEDNWTNKLTFLTVEGVDLDDCLDYVNKNYPSHTIEKVTFKQKSSPSFD